MINKIVTIENIKRAIKSYNQNMARFEDWLVYLSKDFSHLILSLMHVAPI